MQRCLHLPLSDTRADAIPVHIPAAVMRLPHTYFSPTVAVSSLGPPTPLSTDEDLADSQFPVVALGGTFDHLHAGHKILLSMAIWITREKLIVGLTDDALLVRKRYAEVLESLFVRETRLRAFLMLVNPALTYDIVPINDVYGPTGWDENIQALVVSKETESGAQASTCLLSFYRHSPFQLCMHSFAYHFHPFLFFCTHQT